MLRLLAFSGHPPSNISALIMKHSPKIRFRLTVRQLRAVPCADAKSKAPNDADNWLSAPGLEYKSSIVDPTQVVLVAEDTFEPTESAHVYEALRRSILNRPGKSQDARVVVGVCSIVLKPGSPHAGSFYAHNQLQCKATARP